MNVEAIQANIEDVLEHYDEDKKPLLRHQILAMVGFIIRDKEVYNSNKEVRIILDLLLTEIINGKFVI